MMDRIRLSEPHLCGSELDYVTKAIRNSELTTYDSNVSGFENDLEIFLGERANVVSLSSGTAAIHLSLILLGVKPNDEVLCQSFTFCATANPILYQGAKPIFIDSESETWNMSPEFLEEAIVDRLNKGSKPKAIIVVHLYGMPSKIDSILEISKKYDIPLIEDAAEALGATYKGQKCGTFGDYSILSFNTNKIITTSGGGALVCKNNEEKEKAIFYASQARDKAPHYQHSKVGYNYRMSNINAAIGRGQMKVLNKNIKKRRNNNIFYKKVFEDIEGIEVFHEKEKYIKSNNWLSCITFEESKSPFKREQLIDVLKTNNIESRPLWKPMHLQPVYKESEFYGNDFCKQLFKTGLCLPSSSNLKEEDLDRIAKIIKSI